MSVFVEVEDWDEEYVADEDGEYAQDEAEGFGLVVIGAMYVVAVP